LPANYNARGVEIAVMLCPSDTGRGTKFEGKGGNWARGNYAYNGFQYWPNDYLWWAFLNTEKYRPFYKFNLGIGGIEDQGANRQVMSMKKVVDGTTKTIILAELRVGLSPRDRRGVWAMGLCGSNIHCRNASKAINSCYSGDDDVFGKQDIIDDIGTSALRGECMMPDTNTDFSGQSVVRSRHPGCANVAMVDGSVHFLSDFIDAGNINDDGIIDWGGGDAKSSMQPGDDAHPNNFRVWQRLLISRDGYDVESVL
jgi:prepilin-type processing-associated H-X9-DG protein